MSKTNFGYIHFDDPHQHSHAYVSVSGEPATRIQGTHETPSNIIFLTNLNYNLMFDSGMGNHSRYRNNNFLRCNLDNIYKLSTSMNDDSLKTEILSCIFKNVMYIVDKVLKLESIPKNSLRQGIRLHLLGYDNPISARFKRIIKDATSYYVQVERDGDLVAAEDQKTFSIPMLGHLKNIFSMPYPAGKWTKVDKFPRQNQNSIKEWVLSQKTPFLAKIKINYMPEEFHRIVNFGSNPLNFNSTRQWVTTTELLLLISVNAELEILDAYSSEKVIKFTPLLDRLKQIPEICNLSKSFDIFLENLWSGLSCDQPDYRNKNKNYVNPLKPFIRAYDRSFCFEKAIQFYELGYDVYSYGTNKIVLDGTYLKDTNILNIAESTDTIPPICNDCDTEYLESKDVSTPIGMLQKLYATDDIEKLVAIDNQVVAQVVGGLPGMNDLKKIYV